MYGETFYGRHSAQRQLLWSLNNLIRGSFRNTVSKVWKQQTVFSWEILADKTSVPPLSPRLSDTLFPVQCWTPWYERTRNCKNNNTTCIFMYVESFYGCHMAQCQQFRSLNNLTRRFFGNTASKVWKQQAWFDWVCSWEVVSDRGHPRGWFGRKVALSWLTSPYFELREKWKCIEHIGKLKNLDQNFSLKVLKMSQNFSLSESSRLTPAVR